MGGSLACEPARLAGEWAGQFGKLARGKRGWTLDSGQCTRRIHRQMMLLCCTAVHKKKNGVLQTKPLRRSQYHKADCGTAHCTGFHPIRDGIDGHDQQSKEKIKMTQT